MHKYIFKWLAVFLLSGATTFAGSFTNSNFSNPNLYTLNQLTDPDNGDLYPIVTNSELLLVYNDTNMGPISIVLNNLDTNASGGVAIDSFTATFGLQMGPATSTPADGFAFVFGPDILSSTTFGEGGPAMPDGGVAVCFFAYDETLNSGAYLGIGVNAKVAGDGADDTVGVPAGGYVPMSSATMVDSQMHNVWMQVKRNGTLSMVWNGQTVFTNLFLTGWSPVAGQFAIGGENGGASEQVLISNLLITTIEEPSTPVAPIITSQPQSITIHEGTSASFAVGFDGDAPFTFQWTENTTPIPDATNSTLTLTEVSYTNNDAQFVCSVSNPEGSVNTAAATLTMSRDTTPPTVISVLPDTTFTNLTVSFSKPVSDTALVTTNYTLSGGVTVLSATRLSQTTVTLGTSLMATATTYTLTINGVQDMAATPNTIAPNTKVTFETFVPLSGSILHKVYYNTSPDQVTMGDNYPLADLLTDPRYTNNTPDAVDIATSWEWPPDDNGTFAAYTNKSMFYDSLEGYFIPPATGEYVFYTCGDDEWYLYLSTNETAAGMEYICGMPCCGWTDNRGWTQTNYNPIATANSESNTTGTWPTTNSDGGALITLTEGVPYYMILFHHDHSWSGGDWYGATYTYDTTNVPAYGDPTILLGSVIGFDFNPAGTSIAFNQQPQSVTALEGTFGNFSVEATGTSAYGTNVVYQWQDAPPGSTNWVNIAGATANTVATSLLTLADSGTQYRVIATMTLLSATSTVATVTVSADTTPPVLSAGAMTGTNAGTVDIGVGFNKTVEDATGSVQSNYSVSSGTITSFLWCSNRFTADSLNPLEMVRKQSAMLTVTGFSSPGTVTVKNISDLYGNTVTSTNIPVTVATNLTWGVVGANELGGWNAAVPVGPSDFDVYCDGIQEWSVYDETTFVYEQVTGDFDKVLRVQYQDGSSEWARAGIVARDVLNFGVDREIQSGSTNAAPPYDGTAGRYQKCHVNPVGPCLTGPGTPANASWEGNRRLDTGGPSDSCLTNVNATPLYPNAWCRLQRRGQKFTIFRSADGTNWELLGQTVWGPGGDALTTNPMPATVYVGPEFSPENGNINDAIDQGTFLAQFRDYGDYVASTQPTIAAAKNADGTFTLTYTGTLQSSANVNGPYSAVSGAASPFNVNPKATGAPVATFYRAGP